MVTGCGPIHGNHPMKPFFPILTFDLGVQHPGLRSHLMTFVLLAGTGSGWVKRKEGGLDTVNLGKSISFHGYIHIPGKAYK